MKVIVRKYIKNSEETYGYFSGAMSANIAKTLFKKVCLSFSVAAANFNDNIKIAGKVH